MPRKKTYQPIRKIWEGLIMLVTCCLSVSCISRHTIDCEEMSRADSLIESDFDSCRIVLEEIDYNKLSLHEQMHWQFLHEYVLLKLWDHTSPDSIMPVVIRYFDSIGDREMVCKCLYVQGAAYEQSARDTLAMLSLKKAEEYIPYVDPATHYAGQIYYIEGAVFENSMLYHLAYQQYRKALPYFEAIQDFRRASYCYRDMAYTFYQRDRTMSNEYVEKAYEYARRANDTTSYWTIAAVATPLHSRADSVQRAEICKKLCLVYGMPGYADYLVEYHLRYGDLDTAAWYLELFAQDTIFNIWNKERYTYLSSMLQYARGANSQAYEALRESYVQFRQQVRHGNKIRAFTIARQFDVEKEKNKTLALEVVRLRLWVIVVSVVGLFGVAVGIGWYVWYRERVRRKQKEQEAEERRRQAEHTAALLVQSEEKRKALQLHVNQLNTDLEDKREMLRKVLRSRLDLTRDIRAAGGLPTKIPIGVRKYIKEHLYLDIEKWSVFRTHFNTLYAHLLDRLVEEHPAISERDEQLIALSILGLGNSDIAFIMQSSERTVWNRRQTVKERLGDAHMNLDAWFLRVEKETKEMMIKEALGKERLSDIEGIKIG